MKVILLKNVDRLGTIGDVVTVKVGFARNYLLPSGQAKEATTGNLKMLDGLKKKLAAEDAKKLNDAKALADKIGALSLTINVAAGDDDKLCGSVSSEMIAEALAQEEITVEKHAITIDEPIKKLGVYTVTVKVHADVKTPLKVWVVKKQ